MLCACNWFVTRVCVVVNVCCCLCVLLGGIVCECDSEGHMSNGDDLLLMLIDDDRHAHIVH